MNAHTSRLILALSLLFFAVPSGQFLSAQPTIPDGAPGKDFNALDAEGRKDGRWVRVYPNGKLYYSGTFDAGQPVGHFTFFHENGGVHSEITHEITGDLEGGHSGAAWNASIVSYREEGTVLSRGEYTVWMGENGEPTQEKVGLWRAYDKSGRVRRMENYQSGVLHGEFKSFYADGTPLEEGMYDKGKRQDLWTRYHPSGMRESEQTWAADRPEGVFVLYHESGAAMTRGYFRNGLEAGAWKLFLADGRVHSTVFYNRGVVTREVPENGTFERFYPSERPKATVAYKNGKLHGSCVRYHDNGDWTTGAAQIGTAGGAAGVMGGLIGSGDSGGDLQRFLKGQTTKEKGAYVEGVKDGNWRYFDGSGLLLRTERWSGGQLESKQ